MTNNLAYRFLMKLKFVLFVLSVLLSCNESAVAKTKIRLGALAFGTANWELAALKNEGLLNDADFTLEIVKMANPQAAKIALQSDAVDIIVSDWIWVSRIRGSGADYTFYPYSNTSGALMVPSDSPIKSIFDLPGKKLGIAGGELDKNWLLLQALGLQHRIDLNNSVDKVFGAPPLLNQQLEQQRIDAVINYWHYAARLEAKGYRQLMTGQSILQQLGIPQEMPSLGYVFRYSWGTQNKTAINNFLERTKQAKQQLCTSNTAWGKIASLTQTENEAEQAKLRQRYCEGLIRQWGIEQKNAAEKIYQLLRQLSGDKLTGKSTELQPGTFWQID